MNKLLAVVFALTASVGCFAAEKGEGKPAFLGAWGSESGNGGFGMHLCEDGRGLAMGYIGALPISWRAQADGSICVMCPQGQGHIQKMVFRYDQKKDVMERFEDTMINLVKGKANAADKKVMTFVRPKLDDAQKAQMSKELDAYFKAFEDSMAHEIERNKKIVPEAPKHPGFDIKEFTLSEKAGVGELVDCLKSGGDVFLWSGTNKHNDVMISNEEAGLRFSLYLGDYVYGDESMKDPMDETKNVYSFVESIPESARAKTRGADKSFVEKMTKALSLKNAKVTKEIYCCERTYYAEFTGNVNINNIELSTEEAVKVVIKSLHSVDLRDVSVKIRREK